MRIGLILAAALLIFAAASANAEPAGAVSAVAAPDRTDSMRKLDGYRKPAAVLQFLGLEEGDRALDLFGSGGYYGMIMARAVGSRGSVDSWESENFVSDETRKNWDTLHRLVPNLRLIVSPAAHIQLPENTYD